jgi:cation-transporting ATPase I
VVSQFFGCTPLGPVAWSGVMGATGGATAISWLAPNWLNKAIGAIQPNDEPDDE